MSRQAAELLAALTLLERSHEDALPLQVWRMLPHGAPAAWRAAERADAAALQRRRAWQLLDSAGRWRRRHLPDRAAANLAAARQALGDWRALALVKPAGCASAEDTKRLLTKPA